MVYLNRMNSFFHFVFALPVLLTFGSSTVVAGEPSAGRPVIVAKMRGGSPVVEPASRSVPADNDNVIEEYPLANLSGRIEQKKLPCESLQITERGVVCDGYRLDFPEVVMKDVLEGDSQLPRQVGFVTTSEKIVDGVVYRNLSLFLRWEPATPEFLQIHLKEYLPYWGARIPYRLFWQARYDVCDGRCSTLRDKGEILPSDLGDLSPALAADVNFNGVPVAFWNANLKP